MVIGIISKPEHAKAVIAALRKDNHEALMLGSNPSLVPPRVEVIVCRVVSASRHGVSVAQAERRSGKRPVIFEESPGRIIEAISQLPQMKDEIAKKELQSQKDQAQKEQQRRVLAEVLVPPRPVVSAAMPQPVINKAVESINLPPEKEAKTMAVTNIQQPIDTNPRHIRKAHMQGIAKLVGFFNHRMVFKYTPESFADKFGPGSKNMVLRTEDREKLIAHLKALSSGCERYIRDEQVKVFQDTHKAYDMYFTFKGMVYKTPVWASSIASNQKLAAVANLLDLALTPDPTKKLCGLAPGGSEEYRNRSKAADATAKPVVVAPKPAVVAPTVVAPIVAKPVVVAAPKLVEVPVSKLEVKPSPSVAASSFNKPEDLAALNAMCREMMAKHNITEWHVFKDGQTTFKRVVVEEGKL